MPTTQFQLATRGSDRRVTWAGIDERDDHYLALAGANVVATDALTTVRDNLADVVAAKAMMCVHGDAGLGKALSVNASLRALAPADVCRVQFRARRPHATSGMCCSTPWA
jgi:hypothetical protein